MEKIKLTYNQISQMVVYFKSLENSAILTFAQRRKVMPFNKLLAEQSEILNKQTEILLDKYGEKDERGKPIQVKNSGYKIKEECFQDCTKELEEVALTEIELEYEPFKLPENYFDNFRCDTSTFMLINDQFIEK